jgi:hypothetical protein
MRTITVEVSRTTVESIQIEMPIEDDADLADISLEKQAEARQIAGQSGDDDWSWQDTKLTSEIVADELS